MTDQSPEPSDPWAPPERPAVDLGKPAVDLGKGRGGSGDAGVHDQPTIAGMPGATTGRSFDAAAQPFDTTPHPFGTAPQSFGATAPIDPAGSWGQAPGPAYGYPAQPDPAGYGYPGAQLPGRPAPYTPWSPVPTPPSNGLAITGFVLGLLSVLACPTMVGPIALGIAGIVFGALGRGKANRGEAGNGGLALAGLILGSVGIVIGVLVTAAFLLGPTFEDVDRDGPYEDTGVQERI
ncbi:DUF4190 domain-containing protein [Streptomyces sp. NBC_00291]|uniref:DUF4190 domain-containing protein n=1 Tax=Streptomyces sp. NBC_00291 TaxID=2975704 RepID=UPI00225B4C04|nr:DUF4190 domain-containing protein [Streptomyces sp. NBC_00291]MCX5155383.1 DUF4190 domain-containing protein [Streptomyces sp. NBC_00291]